MGRFRADAVVIRHINNLKIVFYDHETIYVSDGNKWYVFHRWFAPRGSYNGGWRQFRHLLFYEKNLDLNHCYHLAFRWEISTGIAKKEPDLTKFKIKELFP